MHATKPLVFFATLAVSIGFGCGGSAAPAKSKVPKASGTEGTQSNGNGTSSEGTAAAMHYSSPKQPACMFHQQAAGHYSCLAGADGQCFHYGAVCVPEATCSLDLSTGRHKECKSFTEGACDAFGADCKPKTSCLYDLEQRRYRSCDSLKTGGCRTFGAVCDPLAQQPS